MHHGSLLLSPSVLSPVNEILSKAASRSNKFPQFKPSLEILRSLDLKCLETVFVRAERVYTSNSYTLSREKYLF